MYASLFEQSFNLKTRATSSRITIFLWIIGMMFITYSYKAVLLASISFPNFIGIRNIKELSEAAQNLEIRCITFEKNTFLINILRNSTAKSFRRIADCMGRTPQPYEVAEYLRNPSYKKAYLNVDYYLTEFKREMSLSEDTFFLEMMAVAVSKTFCCLHQLNNVIYRITEAGLIIKYLKEREFFLTTHFNGTAQEDSLNQILAIDDLFGAFMILYGGLVSSTVIFMVEVIFYKLLKLKKRTKINHKNRCRKKRRLENIVLQNKG